MDKTPISVLFTIANRAEARHIAAREAFNAACDACAAEDAL